MTTNAVGDILLQLCNVTKHTSYITYDVTCGASFVTSHMQTVNYTNVWSAGKLFIIICVRTNRKLAYESFDILRTCYSSCCSYM